ncbi:MAG TPA: PAS domain-containing protein [Opitutaceae bacterium]
MANPPNPRQPSAPAWLNQKEEMGRAIAVYPWEKTPLGPLEAWPVHLRLAVNLVLDSGSPMALIWGPDYRLLYNGGYRDIIQDKHPRALGAAGHDIFSELWDTLRHLFEKAMRGEPVVVEDLELVLTRRGETKPAFFSFSYTPVRSPEGRVEGFLVVVIETTSRLAREKEHARVFDTVLSSITDFAYTFDREGRFLYANKALLDLWGLTLEQAVGKNFFELNYPEELAARLQRQIQQVVSEGKTVRDETPYVSPSGQEGYYEYIFSPVLGPDGAVSIVAGSTRDVSARKQLELDLRRSDDSAQRQRRLYEAVVSNTPDLIYVFNLEHRFTFANQALLTLWGKTWDEAIGRNCLELGYEPWHAQMHDREIEQVKSTKRFIRGDVSFPGPDGVRWFDYIFAPVIGVSGDVEAIAGTTRDVTEERRAAASVRFLGDLTQSLSLINDEVGIIRRTVTSVGRHLEGHRCYFLECLESEDLLKVSENWVRDDAPSLAGTYSIQDFGGTAWWREFSKGDFAIDDTEAHPLIGAKERENHRAVGVRSYIVQPVKRSGKWLTVLAVTDDRVRKWTGDELRLLENVGARVWPLVERVRSDAALRVARDEALAASQAKDEFLATLSHELRTPLNPIMLLASDAADNPELPEDIRADFRTISQNVRLEARLIDDLLDLTRIERNKLSLDLKAHDIHLLLGKVIENVGPEIRAKEIALTMRLDAPASVVTGDEIRLHQIFWNLLRNAAKFTPAGGMISVSTRASAHSPDILQVEIADTGIGLTADELGKVFNPFMQGDHTAKDGGVKYGGLGLGLAISRKIAELHSGTILASSPGRDAGATFVVELPLGAPASSAPPKDQAAPPACERPTGPACRSVLLIEDHSPSRQALARVLTSRKIDVTEAANAAEALEKARIHAFDLVISDIGLPGINGYDLMRTLHSRYGCRGIALSGYGTEQDIARSKQAGFLAHLTKPIQIEALDDALSKFGTLG